MYVGEAIRDTLLQVLQNGGQLLTRRSETARAFALNPASIPKSVLVRHWVEHVHRIRLFRPLDARATSLLVDQHPGIAEAWGHYARAEAVHDRYFIRDLAAMGLDRGTVDQISPFNSTTALIRFMEAATHSYGALPVILYSFWTEENSDVGSANIVEQMTKWFGPEATRGASGHRQLDETLDHTGVITQLLATMIQGQADLLLAAGLLEVITDFIGDYFEELERKERPGQAEMLSPLRSTVSAASLE